MVWATYYGGSVPDGPQGITTDALGNVYVTGYTDVPGFPLYYLEGAYYRESNSLGQETIILKFNSNGVRQWATLYGGGDFERGGGIAVDNLGNLYITGVTSSSDFPLEDPGGGAYFDDLIGPRGNDCFILKFNSSGVRIWATFFGGTWSDYFSLRVSCEKIAIDQNGNLYITGQTSSNDFPSRNPGGGAYIQGYRDGLGIGSRGDAFIAKFDSSNNLVWSTCYGGSTGAESGNAITTDNFGNIFVTGTTNSSDFPVFNQGGAYSQLFGGNDDVFILKFNSAGVCLWATYYGGLLSEGGEDIVTDASGNVYITGSTGSGDFPTYDAGGEAYFQMVSTGGEAFILKFDNTGVRKWATFYGGALGGEVGNSLATDISGNLFITGLTGSEDFPLYGCAYHTNDDTGIFVLEFDTSGILKWANTFANGWGAAIATDNSGYIYVTGEVIGNGIINTVNPGGGAYYQSVRGGSDDGYILKFAPSLKAVFDHTTVCLEDTTFFMDKSLGLINSWRWNFDDPASEAANTSNEQHPYHIFSAPGTYNVKLIISDCAFDSIIIPVTVYPLPPAEAGNNVAICSGDSVILNASGGGTYSWTPSTSLKFINDSIVNAGPSSTTIYIVTVTDTNGCVNRDSVTVTVNPLPGVNLSPNVPICVGDSTVLTALGGETYTWSPEEGLDTTVASSVNASPSVTTTYTVTVVDSNGCINKDSVTITINPLPNANAGSDVTLCPGESTMLTASGGVTYSWSPSAGLNDTTSNPVYANPAFTTDYIVTVTDVNGCRNKDTVTVIRLDSTTATTSSTPTSCSANNGSGTVTPDGVNAPYTYSWFPGGGTTATVSDLAAGIYICTVTDAGGYAYDFNVTIDNLSGLSGVLASQDSVSCNGGNDGTATVAASGGISPYSFEWSTSPSQNTATATGLTAGYHSCIIRDADNCTYLVSVSIKEPSPLVLTTSSTPDVCRTSNGSASVATLGGTPPYSYAWDGSSAQTPDIYNLSAGNYSITVTDKNGCTATASVNVAVAGSLVLNIDKVIQAGCTGACGGAVEITVTGTAPYSFSWNTSPPQTTEDITGLCPGDYTLLATDADNCRDSVTVIITEIEPYTVSFTAEPKEGCAPLCVSFNNTTPNTDIAVWHFGDGELDSGAVVSYCYTEPGNYSITLDITDIYGCSETLTVEDLIQVFPNPVADFSIAPTQGNSLTNALILFIDESKGVNQWLWDFGDLMNSQSSLQNPTFTYDLPGNYTIMLLATNSYDCSDTVSHTIYIEPEFTIYIPNAFTPDGDGLNDFFAPEGVEFTDFEMSIFNRWGEMIYQTSNIDKPWDGNSKSDNGIQEGVYVYKIWMKDFKDVIHYYVGNVTLIK